MKKFSAWYFVGFIFGCLLFFSCTQSSSAPNNNALTENLSKQKGAHLFGSVDTLSFQYLTDNNFEWVTFVPWGDQKDIHSPTIASGVFRDQVRNDSTWRTQINLAHDAGLKVFLKPHIWLYEVSDGKWRSDIFPSNNENWETWKSSYRKFILFYAQLAEETNVELLCIGVEFTRLALRNLIFGNNLFRMFEKFILEKLLMPLTGMRNLKKLLFGMNSTILEFKHIFLW